MTTAEPVYDVVWPLAPSAAPAGSLAARAPDLRGKTVGELWDYLFKGEEIFPLIRAALEARYPGIRFRMIDEQDAIRPHIRLYVETREVRSLSDSVGARETVHVICALSGG